MASVASSRASQLTPTPATQAGPALMALAGISQALLNVAKNGKALSASAASHQLIRKIGWVSLYPPASSSAPSARKRSSFSSSAPFNAAAPVMAIARNIQLSNWMLRKSGSEARSAERSASIAAVTASVEAVQTMMRLNARQLIEPL